MLCYYNASIIIYRLSASDPWRGLPLQVPTLHTDTVYTYEYFHAAIFFAITSYCIVEYVFLVSRRKGFTHAALYNIIITLRTHTQTVLASCVVIVYTIILYIESVYYRNDGHAQMLRTHTHTHTHSRMHYAPRTYT